MPDDATDAEEYELVPHHEVVELKRQLAELRKGASSDVQLQDSIERLSKSIDSMMAMFRKAADEIKLEEHDQQMVSNQMGPMMQKIDLLLSQNEKIAAAIINLAEMLQEKEEQIEKDIRHEFSAFRTARPETGARSKPAAIAPPPVPAAQAATGTATATTVPGLGFPEMPAFPPIGPVQQAMPAMPIAPATAWPGQQVPGADIKPLPPLPPPRKKGLFGR